MRQFLSVLLVGISTTIFAQSNSEITKHFNLEKRLAMQGYDPVSYHNSGNALKGNSKLNASYQDVTYYFSSQANKDLFLRNPSKYEPQYGGWCAFAMGDYGKKVEIDPETFKIIDGKLYLFYNAYFNNTLKDWNKNEKDLKAKADKNWLNILEGTK